MKKILFYVMIIFCFSLSAAFADTIQLKSGKVIECKILKQDKEMLTVDVAGVEMPYFLSDIAKINGAPVDNQLNPAAESLLPKTEVTDTAAATPTLPKTEAIDSPVLTPPQAETSNKTAAAAADTGITTPTVPETASHVESAVGSEQKIATTDVNPVAAQEKTGVDKPVSKNKQQEHSDAAAVVVAGIIFLIFLVFGALFYAYSALCLQFMAKKADEGPAWLAWIPLANVFLMCKIGKVNYLWLLILFAVVIPIIGPLAIFVFMGFLWYRVAEAMDYPGWLGILVVLPLAGLVVMGYLAFSKVALEGNVLKVGGIVLAVIGVGIIIPIMGLLAAIAIPNLLRARVSANEAAAQAHVRMVAAEIESYAAQNQGKYPAQESELSTAKMPTPGYMYSLSFSPDGYQIKAQPEKCLTTGSKNFTATKEGVLTEPCK